MRRRATGPVLAAVLVLSGTAGCGGDESPADAVPALSQQLEAVDDAVVAGRPAQARQALAELAATAAEAEASGDLDPEQAAEIEQAVAALRAALPQPAPGPADDVPTPDAPTAPTTPSAPEPTEPTEPTEPESEPDEAEPDEDEREEAEKEREEAEKEREKAEKEREKEEKEDD